MEVTKPDAKIVEMMIKEVKLTPETTLFVDHGAANIETARKLGFKIFQPKKGED